MAYLGERAILRHPDLVTEIQAPYELTLSCTPKPCILLASFRSIAKVHPAASSVAMPKSVDELEKEIEE